MDYSSLISAVESHKCLYDKKDKYYKNIIYKENKWTEIAEVIGISKDECKKRWGYLRKKFNKELKKYDGTGSEAMVEEWPYYESLKFLKPFIQPRRTKSNFSDFIESIDSTKTDDNVCEVRSLKRSREDPFAESCSKFNKVLASFEERQKTKDKEEDLDDQYFKTIKLMMKELPESYKNEARGEITRYITNLRSKYLSEINGTK